MLPNQAAPIWLGAWVVPMKLWILREHIDQVFPAGQIGEGFISYKRHLITVLKQWTHSRLACDDANPGLCVVDADDPAYEFFQKWAVYARVCDTLSFVSELYSPHSLLFEGDICF